MATVPQGYLTLFSLASFHAGRNLRPVTSGANFGHDGAYLGLMLRNLAAVSANYRAAGAGLFVVAYFTRDHDVLRGVRKAVGVPLRVVRVRAVLRPAPGMLRAGPSPWIRRPWRARTSAFRPPAG